MPIRAALYPLIIVACAAVGFAAWKIGMPPNDSSGAAAIGSQVQPLLDSYVNDTYGFSFRYPREFDIIEYTDAAVAIGIEEGDAQELVAEARVFTLDQNETLTFDEFVLRELINLCAADGPNESVSCTGVHSAETFQTSSGTTGAIIELTQTTRALATGAATESTTGPFFIYDLTANAPSERNAFLAVYAPIPTPPARIDLATLQTISETVAVHGSESENN